MLFFIFKLENIEFIDIKYSYISFFNSNKKFEVVEQYNSIV